MKKTRSRKANRSRTPNTKELRAVTGSTTKPDVVLVVGSKIKDVIK